DERVTHKSLDGKTSVTRVQSSAPPLAPRFLAVSAPMVTQRKHRPGADFHHRTADMNCGRAFPPEDRARLCTLVTLFRAAMVIDVTVAAIYCHESTKFRRAGDTAALRNGRHAAGPRRSTRQGSSPETAARGGASTQRAALGKAPQHKLQHAEAFSAARCARHGPSSHRGARDRLQRSAWHATGPFSAAGETRPRPPRPIRKGGRRPMEPPAR